MMTQTNRLFRHLQTLSLMFFTLCLMIQATTVTVANAAPANQNSPLGTNLVGLADWSGEWPFVDAFKQSRPWISNVSGAGWGAGPSLDLDDQGWVTQLDHTHGQHSAATIVLGRVHPEGREVQQRRDEGRPGLGVALGARRGDQGEALHPRRGLPGVPGADARGAQGARLRHAHISIYTPITCLMDLCAHTFHRYLLFVSLPPKEPI